MPAFVWEHGLRGPSERRVRSGMASMHAALGQGLDGGVAALDIIVVDWEELVEKMDTVVVLLNSRTNFYRNIVINY